jgi:hypothetical protein
MFESVLGTWLPFLLIFVSTLGTGIAVRRAARRAAGLPHELPPSISKGMGEALRDRNSSRRVGNRDDFSLNS